LTLAAAVLAFGGSISLLLGAFTGFWLQSWMRANPGQGPHRYRMTAHKEALWSAFLCFAVAGWIDELPTGDAVALLIAASLLGTGWFAVGQYVFVSRADVQDGVNDELPAGAKICGALAMGANIVALGGLLVATGLALFEAL
jgi:hypothetical protein